MNQLAFIFPGQGSQFVGMGKDLYDRFDIARKRFDQAGEIFKFDLAQLCFEGPDDELRLTRNTQPAIFVHSFILVELLRERGVHPDMLAGHSLGEYTALTASGALEFEEALRLVMLRGEAMQHAGDYQKGTMAAVIGLDFHLVEKFCNEVSRSAYVGMANFNSPSQVVISGTIDGVHQVMARVQQAGAKRVIELNVSGAFHSPLMERALNFLSDALEKANIQAPNIPVYSNVNAEVNRDPERIRKLLEEQLLDSVLWYQSIEKMIADGATYFIEVGPGKVLSNMLRQTRKDVTAVPVGSVEQLELILREAA